MYKTLFAFSFLPALFFGQAPQKANGPIGTITAPQILERIEESTFELDPELRKIGALPAHRCGTRQRFIRLGRQDNFSTVGPEPLFVSPTARANWGTRLVPFDFASSNRIFAVSINLGQCKLCGEREMKVALKVKRLSGDARNDKAYLHFSNGVPNSSGLSPAISYTDIWLNEPTTVTEKTVTLTIPLAKVNDYIFNNNAAFLDIVVQDDTAVDFVTITW